MKKRYLPAILLLSIFLSCSEENSRNKSEPLQEIPEALKVDAPGTTSYDSHVDLTDELYKELVEKDPGLRRLEEEIKALRSGSSKITGKFYQYNAKSNSYYGSASRKANAITDSLLKIKISALIVNSSNKYSKRSAELSSLMSQVSKRGATLNDRHSALKIVLTLPLIEAFQKDQLPDKKQLRGLINNQERLIKQADSLTPKF